MSNTRTPIARIAAAVSAAVVSLVTLTACGGGAAPGGGGNPITGGVADDSWTVMTFMIADTNLEYFQLDDMREQEAVGSRPGFNLISFLDRSDQYSNEDALGLGDFTGAKVIEVRRSGGSVVKQEIGETNTGDPAVLAEFIAWTIKNYPAAHYALIFNDHGSSWPGVGADGSANDDQLTLAELHQGIADGLEEGGLDKLDLVGFDACLMATYETASILQDVADRMLSSEELEPGYGWDYTALEAAARGGSVDELASAVIDAFDAQSVSEGETQVTLSNIDLTQMAAVDQAVNAFAAALTANVDQLKTDIGRSLTQSLAFGATPDYDFYMTDLGMLADGIGSAEAKAVSSAIASAVVDKMDGQTTRGASGMAIYFPPQQAKYRDGYSNVPTAANWIAFLKAYYGSSGTGGAPTLASSTAESGFQNGGFLVYQQVTGGVESITDVWVRYGYIENNALWLVGDENAYVDEQNYAVGFFDTYALTIGDGSNQTTFYSSYTVNKDSGVATVGVPILYFAGGASQGSQGFLQMTYQPSTGTILSTTFYGQDSSGAFAELAPDSGASFEALMPKSTGEGFSYDRPAPGTEIAADTSRLQFQYQTLPSGTKIYAEIIVQNAAGEGASAAATGTIP
ncbi:MAG: hypothetical protein KF727_04405 [Microbacteriaceae bacterium]|nr:hypothetical protein [Microbacteriaceae bacterium]